MRTVVNKVAALAAVLFLGAALSSAGAQEKQVTLPGTIQSVQGGTNWAPADKATRMTALGDGLYEYLAKFPKGSYEYKVALGGSWGENYGKGGVRDGDNIKLEVAANGTPVRFLYNDKTHVVLDSVSGGIPSYRPPKAVEVFGTGLGAQALTLGPDGVWSAALDLKAGTYGFRVRYDGPDGTVLGARGAVNGPEQTVKVDQAQRVTFFHQPDGGATWESVDTVAVAPGDRPSVRLEGLADTALADPDHDNWWTGTVLVPRGQKTYAAQVVRSARTAASLTLNFSEVVAAYPIEFRYNVKTGDFVSDYSAQLTAHDGAVDGRSLYFDSRSLEFKQPFGAVALGSTVTFRFTSKAQDLDKVQLLVERQLIVGAQDQETYTRVPLTTWMKKEGTSADGTRDLWTATVKMDRSIGVYGYSFVAWDGAASAVYANNGQVVPVPHSRVIGTGGIGQVYPAGDPALVRYRLTVYDPQFQTPDWAQDAVYYYIFPERFRNGNPANDRLSGLGLPATEFHKNWLDPKPWVPGDGSDALWCNDFYGGDLAGITQKLDEIRALGANTLYLNPIFQAASNHKYDTADYKTIDPGFGTLADFQTLVAEAKKRGLRVILDTSLNHSGSDSVYMDRYGRFPGIGALENGVIRRDSPFYEFYTFHPEASGTDNKYEQWANPTLATLAETDAYKDFAFRKADSVTKTWLNQGIGGWRMDVAPWKSDSFWREWRTAVKSVNPDAITVAEAWFDSAKYLVGDTFDSTMNYIFRQAVLDYANGGSGADALAALEMVRENYPPQAFGVLMNLLSTHDTARSLFLLGDQAPAAKKKLLLAVFLQMTYPGSPAIYYGDEVGMSGGEDPNNRGPYPWADLGGHPDLGLQASFQALTQLRGAQPVLRRGSVTPVAADDHLLVQLREYQGTKALVAANNGTEALKLTLDAGRWNLPASMTDGLTGQNVPTAGTFTLTVPALGGVVLWGK